jgi:hypothetical protein
LIFEVVPFKLTSFREGPFAMNDETTDLDQTDEDILTYNSFRRGTGSCWHGEGIMDRHPVFWTRLLPLAGFDP